MAIVESFIKYAQEKEAQRIRSDLLDQYNNLTRLRVRMPRYTEAAIRRYEVPPGKPNVFSIPILVPQAQLMDLIKVSGIGIDRDINLNDIPDFTNTKPTRIIWTHPPDRFNTNNYPDVKPSAEGWEKAFGTGESGLDLAETVAYFIQYGSRVIFYSRAYYLAGAKHRDENQAIYLNCTFNNQPSVNLDYKHITDSRISALTKFDPRPVLQ